MGGKGGKVVKSLRMSVILEEKKEAKSSAEMEEGGRGGLRREEKTADTKPGLQGEASPDLQRTTSTSTKSTAPAPEHPTADTKPGLQGEASPDLQRTTSTSTESTAPAPEHPVRNRVGSELLFRDCNPLVLLLVIPIAG
ncbi:UNVERIFIED_CONTAM: hypothetical protein FKN15_055991 [Acipenser sinensis]